MKEPLSIEVERIVPDKPSLRVAVVTETYPPDINGVAHTVSIIVTGLRERGHEITLIRPRHQEEPAHDVLLLHRFHKRRNGSGVR